MAQATKTIKGHKYSYEVKWYLKRKKQIWTYHGKVEKRIDPEKLNGELYYAIMRHASVQKTDRRKIMKAIHKTLAKYDAYW